MRPVTAGAERQTDGETETRLQKNGESVSSGTAAGQRWAGGRAACWRQVLQCVFGEVRDGCDAMNVAPPANFEVKLTSQNRADARRHWAPRARAADKCRWGPRLRAGIRC